MPKYDEWLKDDKLILIEGWARDGLTDEQIAENMGISRSTLNMWKKKFSDISDTLKKGKEVVDRQVENALLKRALGYDYDEVTQERLVNAVFQRMRGDDHVIELTETDWNMAKKYFNFQCAYCGALEEMTKDHLVPLAKGGELSKRNTIPCCKACNSSKRDRDLDDWYRNQSFYDGARLKKVKHFIAVMELQYEKDLETLMAEELHVTKIIKKHVQPDVTAQIFWLKNRKKDKWRDGQHIDYSGELNLNKNVMANLTEEDLRKLIDEEE